MSEQDNIQIPLREYMDRIFTELHALMAERDKRYDERIDAARELREAHIEQIAVQLLAQERAAVMQEQSVKERFASVNEFREQLRDQAFTFYPKAQGEAEIREIKNRLSNIDNFIASYQGAREQDVNARGTHRWMIGLVVGSVGTLLVAIAGIIISVLRQP
jgi:gamma-glutamylcysteine synthetase